MESLLAKITEEELSILQDIRLAHSEFLAKIVARLNVLYSRNPEVFRRPPEKRIKRVKSIVNKVEDDEEISKGVIFCSYKLTDIAGARMTITTKDEIDRATNILLKGLNEYGELDTWSREKENGLMNERGYCAYHYYLRAKEKDSAGREHPVVCEIQVRTLAQDLWAVFSHPEAYKGQTETSPVTIETEMRNYARLMDVADDFAQLIKNRKKIEADEYHKSRAMETKRIYKGKSLLTIDILIDIIEKRLNDPKFEKIERPSVSDLCMLMRNLYEYGVFEKEQLEDILNDEDYKNLVEEAMKDCKIDEVGVIDFISYFCDCHKSYTETKGNKFHEKVIENLTRKMKENLYEQEMLEKLSEMEKRLMDRDEF